MFKVRFLLPLFLLFLSCDEEKKTFIPGYSGSKGELVVVCSDAEWNGDIGLVIKRILGSAQSGLPQAESKFRLIQTNLKSFQSVLKTHRSVLVISGSPENVVEQLVVEKNKYAKGQLLVDIQGDKRSEIIALLNENEDYILKLFREVELNRLYLRNKKFGPDNLEKEVKASQEFQMILQEEAYLEKNTEDVLWIRVERERLKSGFQHQISQGLLVAKVPYDDRTDFLPKNLLETQMEILQANLPGPKEGSYMSLDTVNATPSVEEITFNEDYAVKIRSLWRMQNHFMGGPSTFIATLDPAGNNIYFIFGYVFAPNFDKREYLREVEAMMHSLTWEKATSSQTK